MFQVSVELWLLSTLNHNLENIFFGGGGGDDALGGGGGIAEGSKGGQDYSFQLPVRGMMTHLINWDQLGPSGTNLDTDHIFQVEMPDEYDDDFCESSFFCWENEHLAKLLSDQLS